MARGLASWLKMCTISRSIKTRLGVFTERLPDLPIEKHFLTSCFHLRFPRRVFFFPAVVFRLKLLEGYTASF